MNDTKNDKEKKDDSSIRDKLFKSRTLTLLTEEKDFP